MIQRKERNRRAMFPFSALLYNQPPSLRVCMEEIQGDSTGINHEIALMTERSWGWRGGKDERTF